MDGNITVENKGTKGSAEGISAQISDEKAGSVSVVADNVSVTAENSAFGVAARAENGTALVSAGDITVSGLYGVGAQVNTEDGIAVQNAGDISVATESWSDGVDVGVYGEGDVKVSTGDISFMNTGDYTSGIALSVTLNSNDELSKKSSAKVTTGNIASDADGVSVYNYTGNADVTVGNVDTIRDSARIWSGEDATITFAAGNLTSDYGTAVNISVRDDADVTAKTGDITYGINTNGYYSNGLIVDVDGEGTAAVTAGSVTGTAGYGGSAVRENIYGSGTVTVTVGDVTVTAAEGEEDYYSSAINVETQTYYDYESEKELSGGTATLMAGKVTSDYSGVEIYNNGGATVNVTVGDVKSKDQGAYISVYNDGTISFTAGDIVSENSSGFSANNGGGTLTVQTGSVSGKGGIGLYADRASEWQWMEEEDFEALGLGDPTYIDSWLDEEEILHTEETWVVSEDVEYHRNTYDGWVDYNKVTYSVVEGTSTATVDGDINVKSEYWTTGANLYANTEKQEALMTINGTVSAESAKDGAQGVSVSSSNGGDAGLILDGDIFATGSTWTDGIALYSSGVSDTEALIHGAVSAVSTDEFAVGVQMNVSDEGVADATVYGDISATGDTSDGIETFNNGGTLSLTVIGDVTSSDTGIEMNSGNWDREYLEGTIAVDESELTYYSIDKDGEYTWKEYIHRDGDREIHYDEYGTQWILKMPETEQESVSTIEVLGDVTGTDEAVIFNVEGDKARINMIVDGTLSGEEDGVVLRAETVTENIALTVWEIKPNEDGAVASRQTGIWTEDQDGNWTTSTVEDEEFEKQIQYIIRVEQPSTGSLDTLGTTEYEGYKVAKEGDTVTLKVNVPSGYKLKNAYNGTDTKVQLAKDGSGNYYLIIPKGGAVTLSVTLEKIPPKQKTDEEIAEDIEEAIVQTEPEEAASTKVEVKTDEDGKKTVVLTPTETVPATTEAGTETATETAAEVSQVTVSSEMMTEIKKANVENVAVASKSGEVQVVMQSAEIAKVMTENDSSHLIVDIDEGTKQTEEAIESVPEGLKAVEGAVYIQVKLVDKDGNSTTLGSNEKIKVSLNLEYTEGLQIVYIGRDGVPVTVEPVWVEATDTVPAHWEVPYMGVGSYIPVVPEA